MPLIEIKVDAMKDIGESDWQKNKSLCRKVKIETQQCRDLEAEEFSPREESNYWKHTKVGVVSWGGIQPQNIGQYRQRGMVGNRKAQMTSDRLAENR